MKTPPTLAIVGAGKVGRTLAGLWHAAGAVTVQDILNRTPGSAQQAADFIGAGRAITAFGQLRRADIVLVGTPDDQIGACCDQLAASGQLAGAGIVFHCSGALRSSILQSAKVSGAAIASVHPVRSFARPEEVARSFAGTWCGIEGDREALDVLHPLFTGIGAQLFEIDPEQKILYHAAAVFASNYLVTLLDTAVQTYGKAGVPPEIARQMMASLVRETTENVLRWGPEQALTGPIARNDVATVLTQYRGVTRWDRRYGDLYKKLGKLTAALARRRNGKSG